MTFGNTMGLLGAACIVLDYFLLNTGRLHSETYTYQALNILGAAGILVSLHYTFNLATFFLEIIWVSIAVYGICKLYLRRRRAIQSLT